MWHHRGSVLLAAVTALAVPAAVAGCSGSSGPPAPKPSGQAAQACRALHGQLPDAVDGQQRISLDPASTYTAAWGDPAIELRCGVPKPEKLTPGSEHYNPTAEAMEVNGVSWLLEKQDDGWRFTTTDRAANVEVTVPGDYKPEAGVLTEFAAPVKKAVPDRG
ncbi:DUF3515 domain-containing protein [Streptomyces sp. ODS28]|uniref:DUF3515 domain-containing protein n=1 Tax=Streptomyces sp. ODS28 TaxID=3136688 RepID=UPI0031EE5436